MAAILGIGGLEKDVLIIKLFKIYYEMKDFKKLYENIVKSEWFKKAYHNKSLGDCPFVIDELEESEDERIIKKLQEYVKNRNWNLNGPTQDEALVWLEKQKESKWNKKPCLTCQEYEKGFKQGRLEGFTAGYNKAMVEQKGLDVTDYCQPIHPDIAKVLPDVINELTWGDDEKQEENPEEPKIAFGDWGDKEKQESIFNCLKYMRFVKKITNQEYDDLTKWLNDNLVSNVLEKDGWTIANEQTDTIKEDYYGAFLRGEMRGYLRGVKQKEQNGKDEECTDFTIYHPLKNGKGEYECIPYSFYGSLTSFSEDKDLINFLHTCFYTEEECNEWIEQQKEQKPADTDYIDGIREELIRIEDNAKNIDGLTESQWVAIRAAHRLLGKYAEQEQKPVEWSDEDEEMLEYIIGDVNDAKQLYKTQEAKDMADKEIAWLKCLSLNLKKKNEAVDKLCSNEWSEEDKKTLDCIINVLDRLGFEEYCKSSRDQDVEEERFYYKEIQCLKKLKSLHKRFNLQPKEKWNEEDEKQIAQIERIVKNAGCAKMLQEKIHNWFDSLRPSWKPSEDDIKMLEHIIGQYETGNKNSKVMGYLPRVEELNFLKKILDVWKN